MYRGKESRYVAIASWRDKARKDANQRGEKTVKVRAEGSAVDLNAELVNDFRVFYKPQATRIRNFGTEALPVWRNADTRELVHVGAILGKGGEVPVGPYVKENYTRDMAAAVNALIERYKARAARKPLIYRGDKRGTTLSYQTGAMWDDAHQRDQGGGLTGAGAIIFSSTTTSSIRHNCGMRYPSVDIPNGATIDSAEMTFYCTFGGSWEGTAHMEDADDAASVQFYTTDLFSRVGSLTAGVDASTSSQSGFATWTPPDIATEVKTVVDRAGWATGQGMVVFFQGNESTAYESMQMASYDTDSGNAPTFDIDYTEGGGGGGGGGHSKSNSGCGLRV